MNYLFVTFVDLPSLLILIFAVIGVVTVLRYAVKWIRSILSKND